MESSITVSMLPHGVWNLHHSGCGIGDSVMVKVCAYLNCETRFIRGDNSTGRGKETELMMWIGLLIIVGLLVLAAFLGADIDLPDLF
jgi:hypothetical protein